jgi:hypothetical protein
MSSRRVMPNKMMKRTALTVILFAYAKWPPAAVCRLSRR